MLRKQNTFSFIVLWKHSMGKSDLAIKSELSVVLKVTVGRLMWQLCVQLQPLEKNAKFCALCAEATVSLTNQASKAGSSRGRVNHGLRSGSSALPSAPQAAWHSHCQRPSVIWLGPTKVLVAWTEKYYCMWNLASKAKAVKYLIPFKQWGSTARE